MSQLGIGQEFLGGSSLGSRAMTPSQCDKPFSRCTHASVRVNIQVQRSVEFLMRSVAEVSEVPRINPDVVVDKSIDFSRRHHFLHDSKLRTNGKLGEMTIESKKGSLLAVGPNERR